MAAASVASASEVMANNAWWFLGSIRRVARGIHGTLGLRELRPGLRQDAMGSVELAHGRLGIIKCPGRFRTRLTQTGPKPTLNCWNPVFDPKIIILAPPSEPRLEFEPAHCW